MRAARLPDGRIFWTLRLVLQVRRKLRLGVPKNKVAARLGVSVAELNRALRRYPKEER